VSEIKPGTIMVHRTGGVVVISHRKDDDSGWWNTDRSGLVDRIANDPNEWTPFTPRELRAALNGDLGGGTRWNLQADSARVS
jgi:hypothetical protein